MGRSPEPVPQMWAVYALHDPDGSVRYIGIAKDLLDRVKRHYRECRYGNTHRKVWLRSLFESGEEPFYSLLEWTPDWDEAEKRWIAYFKASGADLVNGNAGGYDSSQLKNAKQLIPTPFYQKVIRKLGQMCAETTYHSLPEGSVAKLRQAQQALREARVRSAKLGNLEAFESKMKSFYLRRSNA